MVASSSKYIKENKLKISMKRIKELFKKEAKNQGDNTLTPTEQQNAITQITSILKQQGIVRPISSIKHYLKLCKNDIYEASQHLTCLALAEVGILINMSLSSELKGVENASGTSCYIDTILFAMYSQETAFDSLLKPRKLENKNAEELQVLCRFFVNLLRSNLLIRAQIVEDIRNKLIQSGWGTNKYSQEDAAEFFLFLSEIFELPYLPFNVQLFHGANEDNDDMKIMQDRILPLSLPEKNVKSIYREVQSENINSKNRKLISIEDLLLEHFNSNKISGIKRNLNINNQEKEAITDAWSVLKLLPFYTSQNELSNINKLKESDIESPDLILPLMIKRYSQKPGQLEIIRDNRPITLSIDINFNNFIKRMDDAIHDKSQNQYRLNLKAVVCHIGTSLQSGHYVVFVRDSSNNNWIQLDDLNKDKVLNYNTVKAATQAFEIMSRNSYLLFYQLKTNQHNKYLRYKLRQDTNISIDHKLATNIQAMEFLNDESNKDKSCAMQ